MSLPSRYHELTRNARVAHDSGQDREAALLREQARQIALQHGAPEQAFYSGTWAALSWDHAGEPLRALHLLAELLADVPSEAAATDLGLARKRVFEISLYYNPRLGSLVRKLEELERIGRECSWPSRADLYMLRSEILSKQGLVSDALEQLELGWPKQKFPGLSKFVFAVAGIDLNLRLGRRPAADRWCQLLGRTETNLLESRLASHKACVELSLWDQTPFKAEAHARDMEDTASGLQNSDEERSVLALRVRTLLLDPSRGDPLNARHPARRRLATRLSGKPEMETFYERRLLFGDYRLSALRWLVDIPPVDDLYYTRPQDVPDRIEVTDRSELQRRVTHVRRAYRSALIRAADLDERWECDWRQKQVKGRLERLEEIVRAAS